MGASKNLTIEQHARLKEYFKCKNDPIYFIEKYIKLSVAGGDKTLPLYEPQKDFIKTFMEQHHIITLKSRQTGVSTVTQMMLCWITVFFKSVVIGVVSKSGPESTDFCRKTLAMLDNLPEWLQPKYSKRAEQQFITTDGVQFYSSQVNDSNPEALLRGKALTILVLDEAAFISKIDAAYTGCAPALFKAQQAAKQNGVPYGTIIISTPNRTVGKGKWYYQNWTNAINGESIYKPFKLHWKMIKEFNDDPDWYKTQCALLDNIHWKIAQELDMQFIASSDSFLPAVTIEALNQVHDEPIHKVKLGKHELWQYTEPDKGKYYLIGVDTATSSGADASAIIVIDFETCKQVAEFRAKLRVDAFCEVISLVNKIYPNNIIIPEANSCGNQVCEYLSANGETYYNIYQTKIKDTTVGNNNKAKFKYGLSTNPQNRPLMIDSLYSYVTEDPSIIKSERLALELIGLVDNGHGKVLAAEGEHDDLALAFSFCTYVRQYDPPLAVAKTLNDMSSLAEMSEIAGWNSERSIPSSCEIEDVRTYKNEGRLESFEHSNKVLNKYVKGNLDKMMKNSGGSTIDILDILDMRGLKNQKM